MSATILNKTVLRPDFHKGVYSIGEDFYLVTSPSTPYTRPFRTQYFILGYCEEGECKALINLKEQTFQKDDYIFLPFDFLLQPREWSSDFIGRYALISKEWFKDIIPLNENLLTFFFKVADKPSLHLDEKRIKSIKLYFNLMEEKLKEKEDHKYIREVLIGLLRSLFFDVYNLYMKQCKNVPGPKTRKEVVFQNFYKLLMENFRKERNVEFYAEKMFITPKHLSSTVKAVSGNSPSKWISSFVVQETKLLLQTTNMSMQEIANTLNFPNQSFFSKYFRHYTGLTPKEYRMKASEE